MSNNPVFIGGLMKSGTSLLRTLLGQHEQLFAGLETHWFEDSIRVNWDDPESQRMALLFTFYDLGPEEYEQLCNAKRQQPEREFIDLLLDYCTQRAKKIRWVEKTPDNLRHWNLIRQQWPQPVLIHVTREYKDTYASWKERKGLALDDFLPAVHQAYAQLDDVLGQERDDYFEVDYIDLVLDTEATMRRVLGRLGEPWDSACAKIDTSNTKVERQKVKEVIGKESATSVSLSVPIFTDSIGQWQRFLTPEEVARIENELAPYYEIFGEKWKLA